jgi:transcriptional regulator with XRE-family HTH domain
MTTEKRRYHKAKQVPAPGKYDALDELARLGPPPTFGELVKSLRLCDEVSQTDLAEKLGISKQHLSGIESGKKAVSIARAARFAEAMGYPTELFIVAVIEDELREAGLALRFDLKKAVTRKLR